MFEDTDFDKDDLLFDDDANNFGNEFGGGGNGTVFSQDDHAIQSIMEGQGLQPPHMTLKCLGHDDVEQELLALYHDNRLPHAMIFTGPSGIGKATFAYRFIRFLLSLPSNDGGIDDDADMGAGLFGDDLPVDPAPSNAITSFDDHLDPKIISLIAAGGHPDFRVIERKADERTGALKTTHDLEAIKSLPGFLRMTSSQGGWRIALIDEAEIMNRFGQNALLKILEEPPEKSILIIITRSLGSLIPTIRSRSRVFHFSALNDDDMNILLAKMDPHMAGPHKNLIKAMAAGQIGLAQNYHDHNALELMARLIAVIGDWPNISWDGAYGLAGELAQKGNENAYEAVRDGFLWILQHMMADKARGKAKPDIMALISVDTAGLERLYNKYNLPELVNVYDKMAAHFAAGDKSFLNKQQIILEAFFKLK